MFPDLTCDDIFRLETKRLWLRWPRASDIQAITAISSLQETAQMTATIPHPYPAGAAEEFVLKARSDNATGKSLTLAITQKTAARTLIGLVSVTSSEPNDLELGYILAPSAAGKGLATEAVEAFLDAVFRLTKAFRVHANTRVINPASRRVLEKCSFTFTGSGLDLLPARGGLHPCDRFILERKIWIAQHASTAAPSQVLPKMEQQSQAQKAAHSDRDASEDTNEIAGS